MIWYSIFDLIIINLGQSIKLHIPKSRVPSVKPVIVDLVAFGVPKTVLFLQKFLNKPLSAQFSVHTTHMGIGRKIANLDNYIYM